MAALIGGPVPRWVEVDEQLQRLTRTLSSTWLEITYLAREIILQHHYVKLGYQTPQEYFEQRLGLRERSVVRRLVVLEGLDETEDDQRAWVRERLLDAGPTKAAILAPLLREQPEGWGDILLAAPKVAWQAVQDQVNQALGRPARPLSMPGERFRRAVLNQMPEEERDRVLRVWRALDRLDHRGEAAANPVESFLLLIGLAEVELAARGIPW